MRKALRPILFCVIVPLACAVALCGAGDGCQVAKGSWTMNLAKHYTAAFSAALKR